MYNNNSNNNFDPFKDIGISGQSNEQRKLQKDRIKQDYKAKAENAIDHIVYEYINSKNNKTNNWYINTSDKANVIRYYKRYWDNKFLVLSLFIMVFTFVFSFYSKLAVLGILIVFLLKLIYSQNNFLKYFLNDHELENIDKKNLHNQVFGNQLNKRVIFVITSFLMFISFTISFYSTNIYLLVEEYNKAIDILSMWYPFYIENELFAYANICSILIIMSLKLIEKWR